jgi:hypothetical protein
MDKFDRIYFDSQPLIAAGWPHVSSALETMLTMAKLVGVEVYLPEGAERELEIHMLRQWNETFSKLIDEVNSLKRFLPQGVTETCSLSLPDGPHVEQAYRKVVNDIKREWNINSVSLTIRPVNELFEMAINHQVPFTDKGAGFQDAVIYLSVLGHLKQKAEHTGVFLSQDRIFKGDGIKTLNAGYDVQIETCDNLQDVIKALEKRLPLNVETAWQAERELVRRFLMLQLIAMPSIVGELLSPQPGIFNFKVSNWIGKELVRLKWVELKSIVEVATAPPPVIIKNGTSSLRDKHDRIKIGARIDAKLHIIVRDISGHGFVPTPKFIRDGLTASSTGHWDTLVEEEIEGLVEVEAMGWVVGQEIKAFQMTMAKFVPA